MAWIKKENPDVNYFAKTNFRNENRIFGIKTDDRRRHTYLIGKTGMGKSTMMENMIIQDIRNGKGVGVIDPHGELVETILEYIPANRLNDVVYVNPADRDFPVAINVLEAVDPSYKHLVASGLMGVFLKIWENMWSARMEYILNNCILALIDSPGNTLLGINRLLVDKKYRKKIVDKVQDPVVKSFWVDEYANYNERFRTEAIAPIQNKVGQFLSSAIIRNIVGQPKSTIDMREIMDGKKILLLNLAKGRIGEDNSALIGAMMIVRLQLAAMSRIDMPESERQDFFLYVDEFQNFATTSFAEILSEARKFRLALVLAHQYVEQLDEKVSAAVFGNVGTICSFRVGSVDAEALVKEFDPYFTEEHLVNLAKYDIALKLMIDGVASRPFSASTLPPAPDEWKTNSAEKVIRISRERYAKAREDVEEKIMRWSGLEDMYRAKAGQEVVPEEEEIYDGGGKARPQSKYRMADNMKEVEKRAAQRKGASAPKREPRSGGSTKQSAPPEDEGTLAVCDNCDKETRIHFVPDAKRNVFCKNCFRKFKNGEIDVRNLKKKNLAISQGSPAPVKQPANPNLITPETFAKQQGDGASEAKQKFSSVADAKPIVNEDAAGPGISLSDAVGGGATSFHGATKNKE